MSLEDGGEHEHDHMSMHVHCQDRASDVASAPSAHARHLRRSSRLAGFSSAAFCATRRRIPRVGYAPRSSTCRAAAVRTFPLSIDKPFEHSVSLWAPH